MKIDKSQLELFYQISYKRTSLKFAWTRKHMSVKDKGLIG